MSLSAAFAEINSPRSAGEKTLSDFSSLDFQEINEDSKSAEEKLRELFHFAIQLLYSPVLGTRVTWHVT
jgi:hypothetical protein